MAITNGYCTLPEIKGALGVGATYTSTGVSFTSGTKTIADTNLGLEVFVTGGRISLSGSTSNDGNYTVATGGVAASIVTTEALTTEVAGDTVIISAITDVADDSRLESVVEAISRAIDAVTETRFYTTANDETRYFTASFSDILWAGHIISVTTLKTDADGDRTYEDTWATTDYDKMPFNAALDSEPYHSLETTPDGDYGFPADMSKGVQVVGKFGYSSTTPAQIKNATILLAEKLFKRKDAPFGVMGVSELGIVRKIIREDQEVRLLLEPFMPLAPRVY